MELKWLEDFLSLADTRSFSRSAEARHVTQPAFSRRIQALELWLGFRLVDRSTYPTTLTDEGRRFRETAEETVRMLQASRLGLAAQGARHRSVAIAALHTLSLTFFPRWLRQVEARTGPIGTRLLPDDFHNCLQAIVEGGYDFLLAFHHPGVALLLDPDLYPHRVVGRDRLVAVRSPSLPAPTPSEPLPLLAYAGSSFLGRMASLAQAQEGAPPSRTAHTNENALAEALKFMALEGHGLAWLPRSLVTSELAEGRLVREGPELDMEIRLYRNGARTRPAAEAVWAAAGAICADAPMPDEHGRF